MNDEDLEQLRKDLRYVKDRIEILDRVASLARGADRHDAELMASAYHPDGGHEHGGKVTAGPDVGEWANASHGAVFVDHLHNITTHSCEIDGDSAHCESYVIGALRVKDGKTVTLIGGRYLDRLERRGGVWKIVVRRSTIEWTMNANTAALASGAFQGYVKGTWDAQDLSYTRPLLIDSPSAQW